MNRVFIFFVILQGLLQGYLAKPTESKTRNKPLTSPADKSQASPVNTELIGDVETELLDDTTNKALLKETVERVQELLNAPTETERPLRRDGNIKDEVLDKSAQKVFPKESFGRVNKLLNDPPGTGPLPPKSRNFQNFPVSNDPLANRFKKILDGIKSKETLSPRHFNEALKSSKMIVENIELPTIDNRKQKLDSTTAETGLSTSSFLVTLTSNFGSFFHQLFTTATSIPLQRFKQLQEDIIVWALHHFQKLLIKIEIFAFDVVGKTLIGYFVQYQARMFLRIKEYLINFLTEKEFEILKKWKESIFQRFTQDKDSAFSIAKDFALRLLPDGTNQFLQHFGVFL